MNSGRILLLLIAAIVILPVRAQQVPEFTPAQGFLGRSEGHGTLRMFLGRQRSFEVESHGAKTADGQLRLDQTVTFSGETPKKRFWIIRTILPNVYGGTLSDAAGPVTGNSNGDTLYLRYRVKGPLVMKQTLRFVADGRTIDNVGTITLLGIPVGSLHEIISRKD